MYQLEYPWLLALLPLPLLVWWLLPPYREETASVRLAFFDEVAHAVGLAPAPGAVILRTNWLQKVMAPLCWALIVVALARPQFVDPPVEKVQPARDLLLALDLSQSMDTRDFRDPAGARIARVEAVRKVVAGFVERRKGDRIGLIAFGDAPYPQAPFTLDHDTVQAMIAAMVPGMAGPRTALGDAIGLAIKMFGASHAPEKVLILLTDGNDTASRMPPDKAAGIARQNGVKIHTVAIGNPQARGEDKVDIATLQKVAAATGGRYFFGQDQKQLEEIYATLDRITPANQKTLTWRPKRELFHIPLGIGLGALLLYQLLMMGRSLLRPSGSRG
ncbi:MAG TPA: VWA domain-containing protein [Burkholderiales bacterium]|nr:VWA domain-containing protein [Burkholderiales bacterium]